LIIKGESNVFDNTTTYRCSQPRSGDHDLSAGLSVIHSPGHTLGCLSVKFTTGKGDAVITGFCCNSENFPENGPAVCPGVHLDALAAWESIQKVKGLGMTILPMHDLGLKKIEGAP
jgi:N-acyl homoserine lactone hydrolase